MNAYKCSFAMLLYCLIPQLSPSVHQAGNESWQSSKFKQWAIGFPNHKYLTDGHLPTIFYHGLLWTCSTLRRRWRIISGMRNKGPNLPPADLSQTPYDALPRIVQQGKKATDTHRSKECGRYLKWTDVLPPSLHIQFFKDTDWSATALGPLDEWPYLLRQVTRFLMSDSRLATLFW